MLNHKVSPKNIALALLAAAFADQLFMVLGALLMKQKILSYDAGAVWGILSLTVSSIPAGVVCIRRNGARLNTYLSVMIYFAILFGISASLGDADISISSALKAATALICGAFIGNFFGGAVLNMSKKRTLKR